MRSFPSGLNQLTLSRENLDWVQCNSVLQVQLGSLVHCDESQGHSEDRTYPKIRDSHLRQPSNVTVREWLGRFVLLRVKQARSLSRLAAR